jgi:ribosomal protein S12 methylthiotransferase
LPGGAARAKQAHESQPNNRRPSSPARLADTPRAPKISFVSLGCPKALVDSERIIGRLRAEGYELAKAHRDAAAVIVNTCGFLDSAKAESLAAIGAAAAESGNGAEREAILEKFPELRWISGPQPFNLSCRRSMKRPRRRTILSSISCPARHQAHAAPLRLFENFRRLQYRCTFCVIPKLRGDLISRAAAGILREAEKLVAQALRNFLSSQDTSAYGLDLNYSESFFGERPVRAKFFDLARELRQLGVWVRLLCLPLSACRRGDRTHGGGQDFALSPRDETAGRQ